MKKTVVALLVLAVVAAAGIVLWQDEASESILESVERGGGRVLGTRVDVARADVRWDSGSVSLAEVAIANPGAFSEGNMVTIQSVKASGDLRAGALDALIFEGIDAVIEFRGTQSNFEIVAERAAKTAGSPESVEAGGDAGLEARDEGGSEADSEEESTYPEEWRIETVSFQDIRVAVRADWTDEQAAFDIGNLALKDVGGRSDDVTRSVAFGFLSGVLETAAGQVGDSRLQESLAERARRLQDRLRELEVSDGG